MTGTCSLPECDKHGRLRRNLCDMHYERLRRHGDPQADRPGQDRGGPGIGYTAAHLRCSKLWGPARDYPCVTCGDPADQWAYDHTDPEGQTHEQRNRGGDVVTVTYSPWPEFYLPLCLSCHLVFDVNREDSNGRAKERASN